MGAKYKILDKLGEGGMGVVHRAGHLDLDREVALKLVLPEVASRALGLGFLDVRER